MNPSFLLRSPGEFAPLVKLASNSSPPLKCAISPIFSSAPLYNVCFNHSSDAPFPVMAAVPCESNPSDKKVYIVHLARPPTIEKTASEAEHLEVLASVVGSHEAAKSAILYSYTNAAYGFSAKLSPEEVNILSGKPGVLAVVPSGVAQLHGKPGGASLQ